MSTELTGVQLLAAAVISKGIQLDGPDYLTFPCGRAWVTAANLEPDNCYRLANGGSHRGTAYEEQDTCWHLPDKRVACRHGLKAEDWA